jgi:hypothetical protein
VSRQRTCAHLFPETLDQNPASGISRFQVTGQAESRRRREWASGKVGEMSGSPTREGCTQRQTQQWFGKIATPFFVGDDTLAGCLLETAETVRIEPTQIEVLKILSRSRMGIYENLGIEGKTVRLKDLATGEQHLCRPASNFGGNKGDLWYVRVLFKGFHHSRGDFIFLTGIPDRDATLPHA